MKILTWLLSAAFAFCGARLTWFMGEGAHYLMHNGLFDAMLGFLLLLFAPAPCLVCALLGLFMLCGDGWIYDDGEES
jgi:hypothetical protein